MCLVSISVNLFLWFMKQVINPVFLFCFFGQNALPSDDDDKDPNDPHKALDIDLDRWVDTMLYMYGYAQTFLNLMHWYIFLKCLQNRPTFLLKWEFQSKVCVYQS